MPSVTSRLPILLAAALAAACAVPEPAPPPPVAIAPPATAPHTPPPVAPPPPSPPPAADIVIAAVGDIMPGSTFPEGNPLPPHDGAGFLAEVSPILRAADLAFGNLEGPLVDTRGGPTCTPGAIAERHHGAPGASCWAFRIPTRYGKLLADAGFDVLSIANNHILDFGEEGRASTIRVLSGLGIASSGPLGTASHLSVRGARIDVVAFSTYDTSNDLDDLEAARALVARSAASADVVVVSFHGGAEGLEHQHVPAGPETYFGERRGKVRDFARAMVDAGASLVLGHGPHVVRGMEIRRGRLIAYSLGNFATYGAIDVRGRRGVSLVLEAHLGPDGALRSARVHPIRQVPPGGPRIDRRGEVIPILEALSREDFGETAVRIDGGGTITP